MSARSLALLLVAAVATLGTQGQSKTAEPTLTPQDSGTTNGLIAVPSVTGYWAVAFASPKAGWLVGTEGRILKISF